MIDNLQIKNFQSHEDSELEFSSGVNVILGDSDVGKSAVIRALRWLIWNKPSGDSYRSDWGGDTSVRVGLDGLFVKRVRTKGDNYYKVKRMPTFRAIKTDVPEEVQTVLNMNEVNIQQQFDGVYLLSQTPGAIAAHFNEMAHLQKIDETLQVINREIRNIGSDIDAAKRNETELHVRLNRLDYVEEYERMVVHAETLNEAVYERQQTVKQLDTTLSSVNKSAADIAAIKGILSLRPLVDAANKLVEKGTASKIAYKQLVKVIRELDVTKEKMDAISSIVTLAESINKSLQIFKTVLKQTEDIGKLEKLCKNITEVGDDITTWDGKLKRAEDAFHKAFPDQCPLCHQKVDRKLI